MKMAEVIGPIFPNFTPFEDGKDVERNISKGYKFRFVSYNILAQVYVKSVFFPHSPSSCLKWKARSLAVLTDLKSLNADFLCVQELDEYDNFYKGNMEKHGYSSIYLQRTGQKRDGCGIFYKDKSAELIIHEEIHYNDLLDSVNRKNGSTDIGNQRTLDEMGKESMEDKDLSNKNSDSDCRNRDDPCMRLERDCVGLLVAFKLKDPSKHVLVVANTHIYWDPEWIDVKLAQAKYLLSRLSRFKEIIGKNYCCAPSVLVAGDFNSTPGDEVYEYMTSTKDMQLCSLYGTNGGEPVFTNCTPGFTGTLDYIFVSTDSFCLKAVSLLDLPSSDSADIAGGLPNHYHPSDHLPIGAEFIVADHPDDAEARLVELKLGI
ncbi:hypothetical protein KSP40_PGU007174 [Platanthera guangdongensis]|uniref:Endonuclease/exonuclease/phosphatase domain-containing protein n=1 Tax=Platanthera guangdongensis TaxID=2320717 RepID=A0ABR2MIJ5_9ASPA